MQLDRKTISTSPTRTACVPDEFSISTWSKENPHKHKLTRWQALQADCRPSFPLLFSWKDDAGSFLPHLHKQRWHLKTETKATHLGYSRKVADGHISRAGPSRHKEEHCCPGMCYPRSSSRHGHSCRHMPCVAKVRIRTHNVPCSLVHGSCWNCDTDIHSSTREWVFISAKSAYLRHCFTSGMASGINTRSASPLACRKTEHPAHRHSRKTLRIATCKTSSRCRCSLARTGQMTSPFGSC